MGSENAGEQYFDSAGAGQREEVRQQLDTGAVELQGKRTATDGEAPSVADRIRALGFEGAAEKVFDLLPLVHVAWADGAVQKGERGAILNVLSVRGIAAGSPGFTIMESLLESKPSDTYMTESLEVLRELLAGKHRESETIAGLCVMVAEASGGFLGFGPVSREETEVMSTIAERLGPDAQAAFSRRLG